MGQHVWLLLATVLTELLVILKWSSQGDGHGPMYPAPFPAPVKWGWGIGLAVVGIYPVVAVSAFPFSPCWNETLMDG